MPAVRTLLGFIYTACVDPERYPLAYRVFDALKIAIAANPAPKGKVRFVALSFDPARDKPDVMRRYAGSRAVDVNGGVRWYFLTTRSARELSHVLNKVFPIDLADDVREIYSSLFLQLQTMLNDIVTLLLEEGARSVPAAVVK